MKRVIKDELIIMEIHVFIRFKEVIANVINQGIIASAKQSIKQVVKD